MNDPIISPWLIYLIDLTTPVNTALTMMPIMAILGCLCSFLALEPWRYEENKESFGRICRLAFRVSVAMAILSIFIPSKETAYKMIAASYITPANIQATGELADKAVDKVIDKIADAIQKFERSEKK